MSERREEEIMSAAPGSRFLSLPPLSSTTRRLSSARGSFTRASLTPTRRLRRLVQRRVESDGGPWE